MLVSPFDLAENAPSSPPNFINSELPKEEPPILKKLSEQSLMLIPKPGGVAPTQTPLRHTLWSPGVILELIVTCSDPSFTGEGMPSHPASPPASQNPCTDTSLLFFIDAKEKTASEGTLHVFHFTVTCCPAVYVSPPFGLKTLMYGVVFELQATVPEPAPDNPGGVTPDGVVPVELPLPFPTPELFCVVGGVVVDEASPLTVP